MIHFTRYLSLIVLFSIATAAFAADNAPAAKDSQALRTIETRLRELLKKELPDAAIEATDAGLTARFDTLIFQVHGHDMTGRVSKETRAEEGPNSKGILLKVSVQEGKTYDGQAEIPQTLREPYWQTYINAYPLAGADKHLWVSLAYGGRIDAKLVGKINALIAEATKG